MDRFYKAICLTVLSLTLCNCTAVVVGTAAAGGYLLGKDERSAQQIAEDAAITARVKSELVRDRRINALDINVDTYNAVVTLEGHVKNRSDQERAVLLAKSVKGVSRVVQKLTIIEAPVEERRT